MNYSPHVEPVPAPLWGVNMRSYMTKYEWTKFRKGIIAERGQKCETCGVEVESRIQAHEDWEYDVLKVPAVARLKRIALSCWLCHMVEHFGALNMMVRNGELGSEAIDDTIAHFCRLNGVDKKAFEKHHDEAFEVWEKQNGLKWIVDWGPYADFMHGRPLIKG